MLTETVATIANGSDRAVSRLQEIEKQIEHASVIEDVRSLKLKFGDCLEAIREEVQTQKKETAVTVNHLTHELEHSQDRVQSLLSAPEVDPVTGLPGRAAAEAALKEAAQSSRQFFAVVIVANRVQLINARFGYATGDQVLRAVCKQVQTGISAEDHLFRWSGPSVLAVLERPGPVEFVRKEMGQITATKGQELVNLGTRTILLPVSASWTVFPMLASACLMISEIEHFVASQVPRE
jgi:GGDEF domain-containing protein